MRIRMWRSRSIAIAVAGSVLLHLLLVLVLGFLFLFNAILTALLPPPPPPEPETVEITFEPEPEPEEEEPDEPELAGAFEDQERKRYIRTTQNTREQAAPDRVDFESDRNTTAAAEVPADLKDGEEGGFTSQEGTDLPWVELATREYVDGELADDATRGQNGPEIPSPASTPAIDAPTLPENESSEEATETAEAQEMIPDPLEEPPAVPEPVEELKEIPTDDGADVVELADRPPAPEAPEPELWEPREISLRDLSNPAEAPVTPPSEAAPVSTPQPAPGSPDVEETDVFQPHTRKTHAVARITNSGQAAVNAAETQLGRYSKAVTQAIEKRWHMYRLDHSDFVTYGNIRLEFQVSSDGKPENLKILENNANAVMTDFTLNAVLDATIPPIPPNVIEILEDGKFNITYDVVVY